MGWFKNLKLRSKLLVGFGSILLLLAGVIAVGFQGMTSLEQSEKRVVDDRFQPAIHALEADSSLNLARALMLSLLTTTDPASQASLELAIADNATAMDGNIDGLQAILTRTSDTEDLTLLSQITTQLTAYRDGRTQELSLVSQGNVDSARALEFGDQQVRVDKMRSLLSQLTTNLQANADAAVATSQLLVQDTLRTLAIIGALALLLGGLSVWLMNRLVAVPLGRVVQRTQSMNKGELGARLNLGRMDEIGLLAQSIDQLSGTVEEMTKETDSLVAAALEGQLSTRGDADRFEGAYGRIVKGINDTLDAVVGPLTVSAGYVDRIANGDIPAKITDTYNGDFNMLKNNLNKMTDNLRSLNEELRTGVGVLATSSTEILATISQVATTASETATAVSETSTTAEEVKQTAQLSAQKAKDVQEGAQRTLIVSDAGSRAVADTVEGVDRVREQMESIAESVMRLSEQGQAIGEIIATVNDLAEQSNLLAVNAAIEATRAGEYGKGFAVVAQEMKSLAEQSRQATTQVRTILMEVQKATSAVVMVTDQGTKAATAGVQQAADAGTAIRTLAENVSDAAQAASQIAASSEQQFVGMDQIASAIASIQQATTQSMSGTRQLEASAQSLQELGGRLKVLVERQRVEA